jgi:hypothetical protein
MSDARGPTLHLDEGVIADGATRYLTIRADGLMQTFAALPEPLLTPALSSFADSVYRNGMDSLHKYLRAPGTSKTNLDVVVAAMAARLGWGKWTISSAGDGLTLTVQASPFAHGFGPAQRPVCAPIAGMFRAVSEVLLNAPTSVDEFQCAACGGPECRFTATARLTPADLLRVK